MQATKTAFNRKSMDTRRLGAYDDDDDLQDPSLTSMVSTRRSPSRPGSRDTPSLDSMRATSARTLRGQGRLHDMTITRSPTNKVRSCAHSVSRVRRWAPTSAAYGWWSLLQTLRITSTASPRGNTVRNSPSRTGTVGLSGRMSPSLTRTVSVG